MLYEIIKLVIETLVIYFPAMAANGAPVLLVKGVPIDRGAIFIDGRRLLGDGKTIEGSLLFLIVGGAVGSIYSAYTHSVFYHIYGLLSGLGAWLGDIIGAFIKRRLGIERGAPAPILDQTLFLVLASLIIKISGIETPLGLNIDLKIYLCGVSIALILHIAANYGAYLLRLKKVPY
ncbi:MAG: CDP-2,3-bis-(O-geranylgeranyl)-sn-glycerol synthase [Sulfolobales archaeon]